jgi:hypothetical protein
MDSFFGLFVVVRSVKSTCSNNCLEVRSLKPALIARLPGSQTLPRDSDLPRLMRYARTATRENMSRVLRPRLTHASRRR